MAPDQHRSTPATFHLRAIRRRLVHVRHIARNAAVDLRFGVPVPSRSNSDCTALDEIFRDVLRPDDVLVDIGCGRGRVVNWWVHRRQPGRMVGLEMDGTSVTAAQRRHRDRPGVQIIHGDAVDRLPADGTVFYLFNPGGLDLIEDLERRLREMPRLRLVLYYNPKHIEPFDASNHWHITHSRLDVSADAPVSGLATLRPAGRNTDDAGAREPGSLQATPFNVVDRS